ncbi:FtsQ-type POTRA domain-containing protein [Metallumcola ferriviriculae]|uniref:FtsQ-type POTRA domain-containing protein n=1 Tax=Metallumcola ferriviriculae TaxID=3039180 RepID=A0AAU0UNW6_9FIRM|nr:FtsQ-type POTRA domain-containing protein [Desulfitibacteraceae bacterium MK1]
MTRVVTRKENESHKRSKLLQALLFVMLLLVAVYFFLNSAFFTVDQIIVNGIDQMAPQTVLDLSGITKGMNPFKIDINQVEKKIELSAMVAKVEVRVKFPDSVTINVKERKPAALLSSRGGFMLLDNEGYYISLAEKITDYSFPLISGVEVPPSLAPGEKLSGKGVSEALAVVGSLAGDDNALFSEIVVTSGYSIIMYTIDGVKVVMGEGSDVGRKLQWFKQIRQQAINDGKTLKYVDVSFQGNPVVKYN